MPRHPPCALSNLTTEISNSHKPNLTTFTVKPSCSNQKNQRPRFDLPRLATQLLSRVSIFRLSLLAAVKEATSFSRSLNCFTNPNQQRTNLEMAIVVLCNPPFKGRIHLLDAFFQSTILSKISCLALENLSRVELSNLRV